MIVDLQLTISFLPHAVSSRSGSRYSLSSNVPESFESTGKPNINEFLPSETLLNSFKRLKMKDAVKAREVCKLWWKLMDSLENLESASDRFRGILRRPRSIR